MLKHFCYILSILLPGFAIAQSFSINPNPVSIEVDLVQENFPLEIMAEATISNNTSETLNLKWVRVVNEKPECWLTNVFDPWISYLPFVDSAEFDLNPSVSSNLNVSAFLYESGFTPYAGEAFVVLKVTNLNNPDETIFVEYSITATNGNECVTDVTEIQYDLLKLYPNPTNDHFQLAEASDVEFLIIYDAFGAEVERSIAQSTQYYNVESLERGIYFVKLFDRSNDLLKTVKLVKN